MSDQGSSVEPPKSNGTTRRSSHRRSTVTSTTPAAATANGAAVASTSAATPAGPAPARIVPKQGKGKARASDGPKSVLAVKQAEMEQLLQDHSSAVSELFHLERLITYATYDPQNYTGRPSEVYSTYASEYDLLTHHLPESAQTASSSSRRTTRRAAHDTLTSLAPPPSAIPPPSPPKPIERKPSLKKIKPDKPLGTKPSKEQLARTAVSSGQPLSKRVKIEQTATSLPPERIKPIKVKLTAPQRPSLIYPERPIFTHAAQLPPRPLFEGSLDDLFAKSDLFHPPLDEQGEIIHLDAASLAREVDLHARITHFEQVYGRSIRHAPARDSQAEPPRSLDHRDHMVEQACHFARLVQEERKNQILACRKIAKMVSVYFERLQGAEARAAQEAQRDLKALARFTSREIRRKWKMAVNIVRAKRAAAWKAEEERRGKLHLDAMLEQSTQMLAAQQQDLAAQSDISDEEETASEAETAEEDLSEEAEPEAKSKEQIEEAPFDGDGDGDIEAQEDSDQIDEEDAMLEDEMDEDEEQSDDSEMQGLEADADVPIEELLKKYGYAEQEPSSPVLVNGHADSEEAQEVEAVDATAEQSEEAVDAEDEQLDADLEDDSDDEEMDGLAGDADRPLEEILGSYALQNGATSENEAEFSEQPIGEVESAQTSQAASDEDEDEAEEASSSTSSEERIKVRIPFLLRGTLRPYQRAGLEWLASLYTNKLNGILADEMGLGKTIQTISLLAWLACEQGDWGPHLVIVPSSVLLNWDTEFKKFLPGFKVLAYYGSQRERKEKRVGWNTDHTYQVVVTSYQLAISDQQVLRRKPWHYLILDEAHHIKNFRSQRWQTFLGFHSDRRLLLTGTPLQNNLTELWSLLYFLMPQGLANGTFANHKRFQEWFSMDKAIESGETMDAETRATVAKLHTLLRPYLLRRLKADVEKEMPGKYEHILYCKLSKRQRYLYDEFMSRSKTRETLQSGNFMSIINCLMQLRKVCNHPDLFEVRPIVTSFAMGKPATAEYATTEMIVRRRLLREPAIEQNRVPSIFLLAQSSPASTHASRARRRLCAGSKIVDPDVVATRAETMPVEDDLTIEGWTAYEQQRHIRASIARQARIATINYRRCNEVPFYSEELLKAVSSRSLRKTLPNSDALLGDVCARFRMSLEERAAGMSEVINRFAFATPAVTATGMDCIALPTLERALEDSSELDRATAATTQLLNRSTVKLSIAFPDRSLLQYDCGKLQRLDLLLRELIERGSRALIFTQMTKVLDILEGFLTFHGHRYLRLDGATKIEQRQILTERFNTDRRILCFISSTRAGGLGINLTGADTVVFYDSDWNPAMDRQCQDRCHRIGQTRDVHIYRLVSEHTIEENVIKKANQKRILDHLVIAQGEFTTDWFGAGARADWRDMLDDQMVAELGVGSHDSPTSADNAPTNTGGDLTKALAAAEDEEDATAAKDAQVELDLDKTDFDEHAVARPVAKQGMESLAKTTAATGSSSRAEPEEEALLEEEDELAGSVDGYMLKFVESHWHLFND
ncbi:uncharacterized protein L969DRAFT_44277 [Mixia osmundae IAM 14324]|uniref:DNA helicase n=1 Tax=Mixia osmundae (strain CBS 9802 / IAM 14324 / JCM 22182 / KY 12970) TaxID=764103 RepID=G7E037_MIXOS|nr:uncharacterized protein L969DRAFT_44277 [Mixia osmundae IAM 14324]KEI42189.1 hypothetical protein L969DRAFT_44277 [Mixia osmundae IAM 14324]GAA96197.1 hypothetical protein E5Q_02861 [Mixia osmundae IAM 14324]